MKNFIFLPCLLVAGCAGSGIETIPVGLSKGVTIEFPADKSTRVEGANISFYTQDGFLGYVHKDALPAEEQPGTEFVRRGLALTKQKGWEHKEVSRAPFVGYVVYLEGTATLHLASSEDKETVYTISTSDSSKIDQILATLRTSQ